MSWRCKCRAFRAARQISSTHQRWPRRNRCIRSSLCWPARTTSTAIKVRLADSRQHLRTSSHTSPPRTWFPTGEKNWRTSLLNLTKDRRGSNKPKIVLCSSIIKTIPVCKIQMELIRECFLEARTYSQISKCSQRRVTTPPCTEASTKDHMKNFCDSSLGNICLIFLNPSMSRTRQFRHRFSRTTRHRWSARTRVFSTTVTAIGQTRATVSSNRALSHESRTRRAKWTRSICKN